MMKQMKSVLVLLAILTTISCTAQEMRDVVFLNNGSILKGQLTQPSEDEVKLQMIDGSVWVFERADILRIEQEEVPSTKPTVVPPKRGFYNQSDVGILPGSTGSYTVVSASFQNITGYQLNEHWGFGLGLGLEYFDDAMAPIFAESRYTLLEGKTSPFLSTRLGYAIPLNNYKVGDQWGQKGGITAGAMLGLRHHISPSLALSISGGYRFQSNTVVQQWWWFNDGDFAHIYQRYNRIALRIGLLFR